MQTLEYNEFVARIPKGKALTQLLADLPLPEPNKRWVAGGALRRALLGMPLDSDVDYFFSSEEEFERFCKQLEEWAAKEFGFFKIIDKKENEFNTQYVLESTPYVNADIFSANAEEDKTPIDLTPKKTVVQAIRFQYYKGPQEIIDSFDFTLCQFVTDSENVYCGDFSVMDTLKKRLVVNKITYPVASLRRILKYTSQGFYMCGGAMQKFLQAVVDVPDWDFSVQPKYID
jgi:hypothetical protein